MNIGKLSSNEIFVPSLIPQFIKQISVIFSCMNSMLPHIRYAQRSQKISQEVPLEIWKLKTNLNCLEQFILGFTLTIVEVQHLIHVQSKQKKPGVWIYHHIGRKTNELFRLDAVIQLPLSHDMAEKRWQASMKFACKWSRVHFFHDYCMIQSTDGKEQHSALQIDFFSDPSLHELT